MEETKCQNIVGCPTCGKLADAQILLIAVQALNKWAIRVVHSEFPFLLLVEIYSRIFHQPEFGAAFHRNISPIQSIRW